MKDYATDYEKVFLIWNSRSDNGPWKTHRSITPDIQQAIRQNLKEGWTAQDMCEAIINFAMVIQAPKGKYKFTYDKWGLFQFLSRGQKDEKGKRWIWFHPNNFIDSEWQTDSHIKSVIRQQRKTEVDIPVDTSEWKSFKDTIKGLSVKMKPEEPDIKKNRADLYRQVGQLLKETK
jgi:hypothetical protein